MNVCFIRAQFAANIPVFVQNTSNFISEHKKYDQQYKHLPHKVKFKKGGFDKAIDTLVCPRVQRKRLQHSKQTDFRSDPQH